jgi:uncharacterized protein YcfL
MKKALICSLVLASIFLVGCAETQVVEESQVMQKAAEGVVVDVEVSDVNIEEFQLNLSSVNESSNLDECSLIADPQLEVLCNDRYYLSEAVNSSDSSLCDNITDQGMQDTCNFNF